MTREEIDTKYPPIATRVAYGRELRRLGGEMTDIVVLDADLSKSTQTAMFGDKYPDRFFNCGIAEANMVGIAAGLASTGKIPFLSSFACFMVCKGYDQFRMAVANPTANIKAVSSHGGITVGEDGASQQAVEDIALMTSLPGFKVMVPSDQFAATALVRQAALYQGPVYIRTGRPTAPNVHAPDTKFEVGRGVRLREGSDVSIIANGFMVKEALDAADALGVQGISASVVDMHTVKPVDRDILVEEAERTGAMVIAEEHQIWGGLGTAVSRVVATECPIPLEFVAIRDVYAESGDPLELLKCYGLDAENIASAAELACRRKSPAN